MTSKALREKRMPRYRKIIRNLWILLGLGVIGTFLFFLILSYSDLPDTKELENPTNILASEVFAQNQEVLGRYYIENRVPVSPDEISPFLVQALVATEDERFYEHSGIDLEALGRVLVKTALLGKSSGGGSTITQQLAKLLFTGRRADKMHKVVIQKFKEWIIAAQLERQYTKEEIMAMYLNKFDFLNDGDGIEAASEVYFGKPQNDLSLQEAAMLVGMLKNPSLFNPVSRDKWRRDTAKHRQTVVLKQMQRKNLISQEEYDSLRQIPLNITLHRSTHTDGLAPYFRGKLGQQLDQILDELQEKDPNKKRYNLYRDGLRIYTTIDPVVQRHMEIAAIEHMAEVQRTFWKHWKVVKKSPWDYKNWETTEGELKARKRKINQLVRGSERYQAMRSRILDPTIQNAKDGLNISRIRDVDIERMLAEEESKEGNTIKVLVSQKMISNSMADQYKKIMKSDYWPQIKKKWAQLQDESKTAFNQEREMTIFTLEFIDKDTNVDSLYDTGNILKSLEKKVKMSPLDSLKYLHEFLQIGSMAVDPKTGEVKGWVGGINYNYFKYDHVTSRRQVGSTFKPFVYASAIKDVGIAPCFQVYDLPQTIYPGEGNFTLLEEWTPANSDGKYSGEFLTIKDGLKKSKNTISVYLMKQLQDTEPVRDIVDRMGIDKNAKYPNGRYILPKSPSICLGATDLSVIEMTGAYTTFANNGHYSPPYFIKRIEDRAGREIYKDNSVGKDALDPRYNYVMVHLLQYAATGLYGIKSQVGGKTGTTNDYVDGWFMGITPNLVIGTWVGGEDRWIRFRSITNGQGAYLAKPYFKKVILRLEEDETYDFDVKARFDVPKGDIGFELDCSKVSIDGPGEDPFDGGEDPFGDQDLPPLDSTEFLFNVDSDGQE